MHYTRIITFTLLFFIILLMNSFAQDYTQWALPEGAKFRFGKGQVCNYEGHMTTIGKGRSFHFSPDSTQFLVMTSLGIWEYDVMTGEEIKVSRIDRMRQFGGISLSVDSQKYAIPKNSKIEIWSLLTNQLVNILEDSNVTFYSAVFHPDGKTLLSTDSSNITRLWDIESGIYSEIHPPHNIIGSKMFSPDGKTLVNSRDKDVRLWDVSTRQFKGSLEDTDDVRHIIFNKNGDVLFALSKTEVRFWDTNTGKIKLRLGLESSYRPPFALSPDGNTFAFSSGRDYTVQLWDTKTGQLKGKLSGKPQNVIMPAIADGVPRIVSFPIKTVDSLAFTPDGQTLAVASDGEIGLWNPETGEQDFILTEEGTFYHILFSPDGRTLAARKHTDRDETRFYLWNIDNTDIKKSKLRHVITGHNGEVSSVAFNSDGSILASGYHLEKIKLWDVSRGELKTICEGYPYQLQVLALAFAPNQGTLASLNIYSQSSFGTAEILLWNALTGEYKERIKAHGKAISNSRPIAHGGGVVYSPDGKKLMSGSLDGTIRLINVDAKTSNSPLDLLRSLNKKATLKGHTDQILTIALSPNGNTLASGSSDKTIRLWDTQTKKTKAILQGHTERVSTVSFSPDGLILASGCQDGSIHLWDSGTGKHKRSLIGNALFAKPPRLPRKQDDPPNVTSRPRSDVTALVFSPDGKTLANGNRDGSIHFWDTSTLRIKSTLVGHGGLNSLTYSPDGKTIASGSSDGTILIWELAQ